MLDKSTGDPTIEAGVEVVDLGKRTRTDLDGKFKRQLAPGTYQLRLFAPLYRGACLQNVTVKANQVTKVDVALAPEGQPGVQVVEVIAQADKAAESTQLIERKKAAVVSHNIAAETIAKSPDRTAAEVVKRVPRSSALTPLPDVTVAGTTLFVGYRSGVISLHGSAG